MNRWSIVSLSNLRRGLVRFFLPPVNQALNIEAGLQVALTQGLERVLTALLRIAMILGTLAFFSTLPNVIRNERWELMLFYTGIISILWLVALHRGLNYNLRAGYFVLLAYSLGVSDLIFFGIAEDGRIYLFCFAIFTTLFIGKRASLWATPLSVVTFAVIAWLWHLGYFPDTISILPTQTPSLEAVIVLSFTFLMTTGLAVAAMAAVVREFEIAWFRERQVALLLQKERDLLEVRVSDRTQELNQRNKDLSQAIEELKTTQRQLIETDKMAALGGLVAGVAHEINTPIGIGVTAASTLADETEIFMTSYQNGSLKRSVLDSYLTVARKSSDLILANLRRAAELVQSFKQVAVDQTNLEQREFEVKPYLEEVLRSLHPQVKQARHQVEVKGDDTVKLISYPGAVSQIVTNLVMNSIVHAYPDGRAGHLQFEVTTQNDAVRLIYRDDGCGIAPEHLGKIFEPFYTTARKRGGTGLGLHIIYNLVTQKLGGQIRCESMVGIGTTFIISMPSANFE